MHVQAADIIRVQRLRCQHVPTLPACQHFNQHLRQHAGRRSSGDPGQLGTLFSRASQLQARHSAPVIPLDGDGNAVRFAEYAPLCSEPSMGTTLLTWREASTAVPILQPAAIPACVWASGALIVASELLQHSMLSICLGTAGLCALMPSSPAPYHPAPTWAQPTRCGLWSASARLAPSRSPRKLRPCCASVPRLPCSAWLVSPGEVGV